MAPWDERTGIEELDRPGGLMRRGLLASMMGLGGDTGAASDDSARQYDVGAMPRAADSPRLNNRIEDDKTRHPQGDALNSGESLKNYGSPDQEYAPWTPQQQGEDRLATMMDRYGHLSEPITKQPLSTKQKIIRGLLMAAPVGLGAVANGAQGAAAAAGGVGQGYLGQTERNQARQDRLDAQRQTERMRLGDQIEAERRIQEQERGATQRMTLQQQLENQREKDRQASQERLFSQQNALETQRNAQRDSTLRQQIDEQNRRQSAQFGEQEKLESMREAGRQRAAQGGAASQRSYQFQAGRIDKLAAPIEQRAERLSRLTDTLNANDPQADALVAPELLTVMAGGQGSGLRMNEAEIARVIGGRTQWGSIKAKLSAWQADPNKGFALTPPQRQQVSRLLSSVQQRVSSKMSVLNEERQNLANSNDPMEHRQIVNRLQKRLSDVDVSGTGGGSAAKDFGPAPQGSKDGRTGKLPDGTAVVVKGGRLVSQ